MTYRVQYADSFIDDISEHVGWLRRQHVAGDVIEAWYARLFDRLDGLGDWPRLYTIDETYTAASGKPSHKVNFGDYLVFYQVDDDIRQVNVVAFMHGARRRT